MDGNVPSDEKNPLHENLSYSPDSLEVYTSVFLKAEVEDVEFKGWI